MKKLIDALLDAYNSILRAFLFVKRFIYYGYIGASKTYDFDASGIHNLIHAHMVRVKAFMDSDKTHLVWNDSPDTGLMKKLAEFTELSRRMADNDLEDLYHFSKVLAEERKLFDRKGVFTVNYPSEQVRRAWKTKRRVALKKDEMIWKQRKARYYYMLEKYVPGFWD